MTGAGGVGRTKGRPRGEAGGAEKQTRGAGPADPLQWGPLARTLRVV